MSFGVSDLKWRCEEQKAGRAAILVTVYVRKVDDDEEG